MLLKMKREKSLDQNIAVFNHSWTDPVEVQGAFGNTHTYSFGTLVGKEKPQIFKKHFQNINLAKQKFLQRINQLQNFSHQNYVKTNHKNIKTQQSNGQEIIKEFTLVTEYIESMPVSTFMKQKRQLLSSSFISIIEQMTNLMIYHCHLNPDSFLLIQTDNCPSSQHFLKICDWGYQNQLCHRKDFKNLTDYLKTICHTSMFQYMHPELLFEQDNIHFYTSYKSKYDIWSFGIILYRLAFGKRSFQYKGSFSPESLEEYYRGKRKLQIESHTLLASLVQKMLSLKGFERWSQVKDFMIQKAQRVSSDFLEINQLYTNQIKLTTYMIEIYKLTAWSINNSANCFWYENKTTMKEFLQSLLKLIFVLHSRKFIERFGHRMNQLSRQQQRQYQKIGLIVENEWVRKTQLKSEYSVIEDVNFFEDFEKLAECLLPLQLRIDDYSSKKSQAQRSSLGMRIRQTWESIKIIKQFSSQILIVRNKIQKKNKNIFQSLFTILTKKD